MKKLFLLTVAVLTMVTAQAQNAFSFSGATHDTLTNSNTVYMYFSNSTGEVKGRVEDLGVQFLATKITGTTVGGYAILQAGFKDDTGNLNWSNYYGTSADSFTIANSASLQEKHWLIGDICASNVRLKVIGNQTQTVKLDGGSSVRGK